MYLGLQHGHSGLRYLVLILLIISIWQAFKNRKVGGTEKESKLFYLLSMIFCHVQLLIGFSLYFISPMVRFSEDTMKDSLIRFFTVEHIFAMLIAIILVTIGYSKFKKRKDNYAKHNAIFLYYGIALLLIIAAIPWPFRNLGAGWF